MNLSTKVFAKVDMLANRVTNLEHLFYFVSFVGRVLTEESDESLPIVKTLLSRTYVTQNHGTIRQSSSQLRPSAVDQ